MRAPRVFLSYSHDDASAARLLEEALKKNGVEVHIDREAMSAGEGIRSFIERSIQRTDATVCVVSNRSLASAWVALETIDAFHAERTGRSFIACYLDDDFFDPGFRLALTEQVDAKIARIDELITTYVEKKLDTNDLNSEKSRLYTLRNNLGGILLRLKESLTLDIRGVELSPSVELIVDAIGQAATTAGDGGAEGGGGPPTPASTRGQGYVLIPTKIVVIDVAVAALSATLIRDQLIPENVGVIGPIASLLVIVCLSITIVSRDRLRVFSRRLATMSLASLVTLLLVQLTLVVSVSPYGDPPATHRFLRGFALTDSGRAWVADPSIPSGSWSEYIAAIGDARIAAAWGASFAVVAVLYSLSYLGLVLGVVLGLGGTALASTATYDPNSAGGRS